MQESDFFRAPVGTGPYKLESWDEGQSIVLTKNVEIITSAPKIDKVIFKIVPDDNAQAMQLESGELDLALLDPKNAQNFKEKDGFTCYDMTTADYRGILFNFANDYWTKNRDIIPAVCYSIDRQAIIDSVLLGEGMPAYSPLQRNIYNNENVEHYDYNPEKAQEILEAAGCTRNSDGFYERDGEEIGFVISVMSGEQDRIDIAQAAAQQLRETGINCTVEIPAQMDWGGQMACLIGWGSPFDADDHTYKVFGTDKGANYSSYSNEKVDEYLSLARQSDDPEVRKEYYGKFQEELAEDPAYAFICYIDAKLWQIPVFRKFQRHGAGPPRRWYFLEYSGLDNRRIKKKSRRRRYGYLLFVCTGEKRNEGTIKKWNIFPSAFLRMRKYRRSAMSAFPECRW